MHDASELLLSQPTASRQIASTVMPTDSHYCSMCVQDLSTLYGVFLVHIAVYLDTNELTREVCSAKKDMSLEMISGEYRTVMIKPFGE